MRTPRWCKARSGLDRGPARQPLACESARALRLLSFVPHPLEVEERGSQEGLSFVLLAGSKSTSRGDRALRDEGPVSRGGEAIAPGGTSDRTEAGGLMARGSTARAPPRRSRPPVADVRVKRPDGTTEVITMAQYGGSARPAAPPRP